MSPRTDLLPPQSPGRVASWELIKPMRPDEDLGSSSNHSTPNPSLHDNLMRRQHNRDPMTYYEVVQVLGFGSIGSVSKVKKRESAVGGSSRSSFVEDIHSRDGCFSLPLLGPFLRFCAGRGGQKSWTRANRDLFQPEEIPPTSLTPDHNDIFYALKTIHLDRIMDESYVEELKNEISILSELDHPNIVRAIETFDFKLQLFMVLELCNGGDLYCRDPYTEEDAARIIGSILSAVEYMHSRNIVHRDLKYENIMFVSNAPDSDVKIIDFGLSKKYGIDDAHLHDGVGTIYTMAPEVMAGDYTSQADLWSVGVLAFMLLSSQMPFHGRAKKDVMEKILKCNYRMKGRAWRKVSPYAKGFVMELLQVNAEKRPTADVALDHPWLHKALQDSGRASEEVLDNIQASMRTFAGYSTLKKIALMVISHKSTNEEIGYLCKVFKKFESHGEITFAEFREALENYGYSDEELKEMFYGANLDGTGVLKYTEFLASTIETLGAISEERVAEAFDRIDSDDSGFISTENLREILGQELPESYLDQVINEADMTHDHTVTYEEFAAMWSKRHEKEKEANLKLVRRRKFYHSVTGVTESVSDSDRDSMLSLPNALLRNCAPEDIRPGRALSEDDDVDLAEKKFRREKALSIRQHEIVRVKS